MNTKKYQEINKKADIKLSNQFEKSLNLSNSEESYEEYTPKELEYIDKYKAMALNRLTDDEIYDIICKFNFNDEKIEREIKEFTKLVLNKGDDYSWTIIDAGKKKKLFINEPENKKKDERGDRYNKNYYTSTNNPYYSNRGGYYNANKSNYKNRTFKKYQQEANPLEEANAEGTENLHADIGKNEAESGNYYQSNYYANRGYTRGRGRQRGRGRGRGNYSYNYRFKEDYVIEKELNPSIPETNLNLKPENLEAIEKPAEEALLKQKDNLVDTSPKKHLNVEAAAAAQKADLHKSPLATNRNISNSDSEYAAVEHFLSSNENNNNQVNKESPQKQTVSSANKTNANNNIQASQETHNHHAQAHAHAEKSTIFINNAISNTNQSKLKNLFEANKERESPSKKSANEFESHTNQENKLNTTASSQHTISTASNLEFSSKPSQQQHQVINANNLHKNLIQESSSNITFNKTSRSKFEQNAISVENNSFGVFSNAPKKENIVSSHQAHNFSFTAQAPSQQQIKFNPVAASAPNKSIMMPNMPSANLNQTLNQQQQQIPNLNNLNKANPQQLNIKNEPANNNPLNMNLSPNLHFNPMMPTANMQSELSAGFQFPGTNPLQQGYYPMFWYTPQAQAGNLDQYSGAAAAAAGANAQMPFMPYPMAYYVNPYMFAQQEANKDAESNAGNVNAKAKKNYTYGNVSAYHGMNPNENSQQTAGAQGISNAYSNPYMYFNSQYPSSAMNQMMGLNSTPNAAWNNPSMNPMGMNMPGQMNIPSYENPNYNSMKNNEQANQINQYPFKFLNQN